MPKGYIPGVPAQTVPDPSVVPNSVDQDEIKTLWVQYCQNHGKNPLTETIPPRNQKVLEFLRNEVTTPSSGDFKSSKILRQMFPSFGGKRTRKHKRNAKKTKKHRR